MSGAPSPELPGSYPTPNSLATLEPPSRVGDPGPEPPGHSHPVVGLTRSAVGTGDWIPEETGIQMGGGSHLEIARELVIKMDKVLGMECQLKGC